MPQLDGHCRLFKNDGRAHFTDITAGSGDLARPMGTATSAAWADLQGSGHPDLIVGCLKSPNRLFRNKGDGAFADVTEEHGFAKHIFNTQAVSVVDLNKDGSLDVIFNNEGQESVLLMGERKRPAAPPAATPLSLELTSDVESRPVVAFVPGSTGSLSLHRLNWMVATTLFVLMGIGVKVRRRRN